MHKDFAEWYRAAAIPPNGDILPKRWEAIEKYEAGRDDMGAHGVSCRCERSRDRSPQIAAWDRSGDRRTDR